MLEDASHYNMNQDDASHWIVCGSQPPGNQVH
jgi:hypothetical protein